MSLDPHQEWCNWARAIGLQPWMKPCIWQRFTLWRLLIWVSLVFLTESLRSPPLPGYQHPQTWFPPPLSSPASPTYPQESSFSSQGEYLVPTTAGTKLCVGAAGKSLRGSREFPGSVFWHEGLSLWCIQTSVHQSLIQCMALRSAHLVKVRCVHRDIQDYPLMPSFIKFLWKKSQSGG